MRLPDIQNLSAEALAAHLAQLEDQLASGSIVQADDATVVQLQVELETFLSHIRQQPALSAFEQESACQKVTAMVQKFGLDADKPGDPKNASSPDTHPIAASSEATQLSKLGVYELISKIGEGGMGAVYKARHAKLDKIVAIKVLPTERMKDQGAVARFAREMRAVGKLEHPNIVRAMDAGEADGMHFLVMEYVEGVDLSNLVKQHGALPIADACELIRQAAVGLDEAHESGMVHRDIKPSNLILAKRSRKPPVVKILDMGLALLSEAQSAENEGLTTTGQMMGTLDYMAPEQGGDSKHIDIRADIYALGATLYRLLCGEVIYHGAKYSTPVQKMMALAVTPAPAIQSRRAGIPKGLAAIVHRMLEKEPQDRYASPQEVVTALEPFCAGADLKRLLEAAPTQAPTPADSALSATELGASNSAVDTEVSEVPRPVPAVAVRPLAGKPPIVRPAAAPPQLQTVAKRKRPTNTLIAMGAGLLGILALLGAIVFFFQTPQGTLRVEINDPAIEVSIKGSDIVLRKADKEEVTLSSGKKTLIVKRGDFTFETNQFELKKGDTTTVKVQLLDGDVQVATADGASLGTKSIGSPPKIAVAGPTKVSTPTTAGDQAAAARWLLENKKINNIGFEVDGQVQNLNAVPSGPCKVRELNFHINNFGKLLEEDIPRLAVFTDLEWLDVSRSPLTDASLASLAPLKKLRWLSLTDTGVTPAAMATIRTFPELERINGPSTDEWLKLQAGMPSIRSLFYYRQQVSPQAMEWFPQYPNLIELQFIECGMDWTIEKLAPLKDCKGLAKLEVSYAPIDDTSVELFSSLKGLVELNVVETKLTEAGVKKIAEALPACKITWTGGVIEAAVTQEAVARWLLANRKVWRIGFEVDGRREDSHLIPTGAIKVRALDFHPANNGGKLLEEDIPRLAVFTDLEYLNLSRMPLTDSGLASLAGLKNLKFLSVDVTSLTPAAVATIRSFPQLELVATPCTDDWLKPLAGMPSIRRFHYHRAELSPQAMDWFTQYPNLEQLTFEECGNWTNDKLAQLKNCRKLSKLQLSHTPLDDTSVDILSELKGLVELNVVDTKLTEAGVKKVAEALPKCKITWTGGVIEPR